LWIIYSIWVGGKLMGKTRDDLGLTLDRVRLIDSVDEHYTPRSGERMSNRVLVLAICI
jgi:hypothetical protein